MSLYGYSAAFLGRWWYSREDIAPELTSALFRSIGVMMRMLGL
jgi:hypothetical protein